MQDAKEKAEALVAAAAAEAEALLARASTQGNSESSQVNSASLPEETPEGQAQAGALVVLEDSDKEQEPPTPAVKRRLSFDSVSSSGSKQKSLRSFWGSEDEKASRASESVALTPTVRARKSEAYEQLRALAREFKESLSESSAALVKKTFNKGGRPSLSSLGLSPTKRKSNRRPRGQAAAKRELSAYEKLLLCKDAETLRLETPERQLWKELSRKYGLSVQTVKEYVAKKPLWESLVEKQKLCPKARSGKKGKRNSRFMRQPGAGRKTLFPDLVPALKEWHLSERRHGHSVSKSDFLAEYLTLLAQKAQSLLNKAQTLPQEDPEKHSLTQLAKEAMDRKAKLNASKKYRESLTERLIRETGASYMVAEQVTHLRPLEEKVRAQLTFQACDRALWAMTCASEEALAAEGLVADAASVIKSRKDFVLGMSDQIPLWAKAQPKKLLFSHAELTEALPGRGPALREELEAARTALAKSLGEADPVQLVEASEEPSAGSELKPGSKVKRARSEADKFRITYEARQKIYGLCGAGTPSAEVARGLLVFPGKHCRLSNLDSEGRYIQTESFFVGDSEVVHLAGEKCRSLQWAVALRKLYPEEFSEIDIMQQPASNMDGVLLSWVVQAQGSEEPCSLYIRDSFAAVFTSEVQQTQQVVNQASVEILGKLTHYLQVSDTDFARSFKALFREALTNERTSWRKEHRELFEAALLN